MPHLFSVHCNTSLPFPFKNSVLRRLLLFSLCGDTMGWSASSRKVCDASQPAFQKVKSEDDILAVEAIAPAGSAGDLAESEDDTAAVEEHAEGGHFTTLTDSGSSFVDRDHMTPH